MRIGIVGYGAGGRYFHAPFIEAADGVELAGVVARSPDKRAEVAADFPGLPVYGSLAEMLDAGVDAVTITTPPHTRRELVLEAIAAGVHVVADKPFAPDAASARELAEAARQAGVVLNVYHNRRRDADILTLAGVIASGELGEVWRVHSIMDQDGADTLETGADGRAPARSGQPPRGPDAVAAGPGNPRLRRPRLDGPLRRDHRLRLLRDTDARVRCRLDGLGQQTQPLHHA